MFLRGSSFVSIHPSSFQFASDVNAHLNVIRNLENFLHVSFYVQFSFVRNSVHSVYIIEKKAGGC